MRIFTILSFLIVTSSFIGCADGQYGNYPSNSYPNNYPNSYPYPQNQYPNGYPNNGYPNNGYPNGYPAGAYRPPRNNYPRDNNNHNHGNHNNNHGNHNNRPNNNQVVVPVSPRPSQQQILPNCPSGTKYNGRTCVITDNRLRKPGGDGNINPCPKGMWNSNGTCIKG